MILLTHDYIALRSALGKTWFRHHARVKIGIDAINYATESVYIEWRPIFS